MPRPKRSAAIEAELNLAIDAVLAKGLRPNFSNVARMAGRARGLLSSPDTAYSGPRERILSHAVASVASPVSAEPLNGTKTGRTFRPRRSVPTAAQVDERLAVASSTIAALMRALSSKTLATGREGRAERLAARERRRESEAAAFR